jgi:carbonic anhydrase
MNRFSQFALGTLIIFGLAGASVSALSTGAASGSRELSGSVGSKSLGKLMDGNKRFVAGQLTHPNQSVERRKEVAAGQKPFATIVTCSDSRVPPEVLFDQGLGDLFVVRVAGNVVDNDGLGSIEYAVHHLHTPLVLVLGHRRCGAVAAAIEAAKGNPPEGHLRFITAKIAPLYKDVKHKPGDPLENLVKFNVRHVVRGLSSSKPFLAKAVKAGEVKIVGAYYDLDSGKVELLN